MENTLISCLFASVDKQLKDTDRAIKTLSREPEPKYCPEGKTCEDCGGEIIYETWGECHGNTRGGYVCQNCGMGFSDLQ